MQNGFRKTKNGMIWQQYPEQTVRELYFATVIRIQTVCQTVCILITESQIYLWRFGKTIPQLV